MNNVITSSRQEDNKAPNNSYTKGIAIFLLDMSLYLGFLALTITTEHGLLKIFFSILTGCSIGLLFLVGHDAAHQSLTPNKHLNWLIGQVSFLFSLHSFTAWSREHNQKHHGFTNYKPVDYVWAPLSLNEYRQLGYLSKALYRIYRGPLGPFLYYLIEIWWKKIFRPGLGKRSLERADSVRSDKGRTRENAERILLYVYVLSFVAGLCLISLILHGQEQSGLKTALESCMFGFVVPFLVWNYMMAFVIYFHHTHYKIPWFNDKSKWLKADAKVRCSANVKLPGPLNWILHRIMEHTAHHKNASIPMYQLKKAQDVLIDGRGHDIVSYQWSLFAYWEIMKKCKLYDYSRNQWLDFNGNPSG